MATAYEKINAELEAQLKPLKGKPVHSDHHIMVNLKNLSELVADYENLVQTTSRIAQLLPGAATTGKAHIEDVFTAFQQFFQDCQRMQHDYPVAAWGKQLDLHREKLKKSLAILGIANHITWEPRS